MCQTPRIGSLQKPVSSVAAVTTKGKPTPLAGCRVASVVDSPLPLISFDKCFLDTRTERKSPDLISINTQPTFPTGCDINVSGTKCDRAASANNDGAPPFSGC